MIKRNLKGEPMKKILLFLLLIVISTLSANTSKLYLKKKLSVTPYLSYANGKKWSQNVELNKDTNIFISFIPNGKWKFKEKHRKKYFENILLQQRHSTITPVRLSSNKYDNQISSFIIEINIDDIALHEPITLSLGEHQSCNFTISEHNWPGYAELMNHKTTGFSKFYSKQYLHSMEEFNYLFQPDPKNHCLSFYDDVIRIYGKCINLFLSSNKHNVNIIEMDSMQRVNEELLIKIASFSDSLQALTNISETYLSIINSSEADKITKNIEQQISNISRIQSVIEKKYNIKQMIFFVNNDYTIYQFHLYMDILAKLLIERKKIDEINKIERIDIQLIDNIPSAKEELITLNWFDDFCNKVEVLNKNIKDNECIFLEDLLLHFDSLKKSEPEPYSQIFRAFNILAKGNIKEFIDNINIAMEKSTDIDNIFSMEMWTISYKASTENIPMEILSQINIGLDYLKQNNLVAAEYEFDLVRRKTNTFAPANYYYGLMKHNFQEPIPANIFFEKALLEYPGYISPRIYRLDNCIDNRDFTTAINEVDIALSINTYWIYYYYKAKILYHMNKYEEAKEICINYCMELNEKSFDLMILMGDIYYKTSDLVTAKSYYNLGGLIRPEEPIFIEKMTIINKQLHLENKNSE